MDLLELLKYSSGMIAILGIFITYSYFLFSLGMIQESQMYKSNLSASRNKVIVITIMTAIIVIFIESLFTKQSVNEDLQNIFSITFLLQILLMLALLLYITRLKKQIFSKISYRGDKRKLLNKVASTIISIFIIIMVIMFFSLGYSCYVSLRDNSVKIISNLEYNKNEQNNLDLVKEKELEIANLNKEQIKIGFILFKSYSLFIICLGYINTVYSLRNLNRYIIKTLQFDGGRVKCHIVFENEKEIMIKCEDSYPIILDKNKIESYIPITKNMSDEDIKSLMNIDEVNNSFKGYGIGN